MVFVSKYRGVDADGRVEMSLGGAALHRHGEALRRQCGGEQRRGVGRQLCKMLVGHARRSV